MSSSFLLWSLCIGSAFCQHQQQVGPERTTGMSGGSTTQSSSSPPHHAAVANNPNLNLNPPADHDKNAFWVVGDESNTWSETQWEDWWKNLEEKLFALQGMEEEKEMEDGSSNSSPGRNHRKRRDWPEWGGSANTNIHVPPFPPQQHHEHNQQKQQHRHHQQYQHQYQQRPVNVHPPNQTGLNPNSRLRNNDGYGVGTVRGAGPPAP